MVVPDIQGQSGEEWLLFLNELDKLIQNHSSVLSLTAMNMPTN